LKEKQSIAPFSFVLHLMQDFDGDQMSSFTVGPEAILESTIVNVGFS
jgi:hypothetical protein